ncbi:site-specific integrase [Rhizosphaericola mali]|uniref:Site-specific integrase n=1 Tax=Rhizosphaericola mali TaxID=2545455 RepID=A0A5P2G1C7_9BACT|nr:site-specific integrase [Rhizosphaericola mali]QES88488.1 site-specific integrase [Rhizosphaericola mali]
MNLNQTFSIRFWQAKSRNVDGLSLIYARITINGDRIEISTNRKINAILWNAKLQKANGKSAEAQTLNNHLEAIKTSIHQHHSRLITIGKIVTPLLLKNEYLGISDDRKTLLDAFNFLLKQYQEKLKIGKTSITTYNKYYYTSIKIKRFLKQKNNNADIQFSDISHAFLSDFFHYLSIHEKLSNNTAMKYISRVKTIFILANNRGWTSTNLAGTFKCVYEDENPVRLEMNELNKLMDKEFSISRLEEARDCFVFMCFTGFAYADVKEINKDNLFTGVDGGLWLSKNRQKTKTYECVPLFPPAIKIINKYKSHPHCLINNVLLPIKSNQKFNGYLKEIADLCEINKDLSTHSARHTFATTVTLENDMPLESVSKMLGHRSLKTTQRYAKVTNKKISDNMHILKQKLFTEST